MKFEGILPASTLNYSILLYYGKMKCIPALPFSKVLSEDPSMKANMLSSFGYESMVLIPLALMLAAGSFLEPDSRRLVLISVFSGSVEFWIG